MYNAGQIKVVEGHRSLSFRSLWTDELLVLRFQFGKFQKPGSGEMVPCLRIRKDSVIPAGMTLESRDGEIMPGDGYVLKKGDGLNVKGPDGQSYELFRRIHLLDPGSSPNDSMPGGVFYFHSKYAFAGQIFPDPTRALESGGSVIDEPEPFTEEQRELFAMSQK